MYHEKTPNTNVNNMYNITQHFASIELEKSKNANLSRVNTNIKGFITCEELHRGVMLTW